MLGIVSDHPGPGDCISGNSGDEIKRILCVTARRLVLPTTRAAQGRRNYDSRVGTGGLCLAEKAGIVVSSVRLEEVATKPVLLLRRLELPALFSVANKLGSIQPLYGGLNFTQWGCLAHFVDQLIRAEATKGGLSQSEIATQLRVNIKDGGVDTQVSQAIPRDSIGWFGAPTCWQFKSVGADEIIDKKYKKKKNRS